MKLFFAFIPIFSVIFMMSIIALAFYFDAKQYAVMKMKFSQFQNIYQTNPNKWTLDTMPEYQTNTYERETISFNLIDWFKYLIWRKRKERSDKIQRNNEIAADMIEHWLKDCERFRKKNETT